MQSISHELMISSTMNLENPCNVKLKPKSRHGGCAKRETETAMQWWSQLTATNIGHSKGYVRRRRTKSMTHLVITVSPCSALTALPTRLLASAARRTATSTTGATTPTACPTATPSPSSDSSAPQSTSSRPTLSPGGMHSCTWQYFLVKFTLIYL